MTLKLSQKQKSRTWWFHGWILSNIQGRVNTYSSKTPLKKLQRKEHWNTPPPSTFYEATITLIPKPDKNTPEKRKLKPISLMNVDEKILNKILANHIQTHIKRIIHHDQVRFIQGCKDSLIYTNQSVWYTTTINWKIKNDMIISISVEKAFDKIQHIFLIKMLQKMGTGETTST